MGLSRKQRAIDRELLQSCAASEGRCDLMSLASSHTKETDRQWRADRLLPLEWPANESEEKVRTQQREVAARGRGGADGGGCWRG